MLGRILYFKSERMPTMENETYVLGQYENENWSFLCNEEWIPEVKAADLMDKDTAFELCEKYTEEGLHVVVFRSKIFEGHEL